MFKLLVPNLVHARRIKSLKAQDRDDLLLSLFAWLVALKHNCGFPLGVTVCALAPLPDLFTFPPNIQALILSFNQG